MALNQYAAERYATSTSSSLIPPTEEAPEEQAVGRGISGSYIRSLPYVYTLSSKSHEGRAPPTGNELLSPCDELLAARLAREHERAKAKCRPHGWLSALRPANGDVHKAAHDGELRAAALVLE